MRRLWRACLVPLIVAGCLVAAPPASRAGSGGGWLLKCALSHTAPDDPIVHPGMQGMSHLHDFFGNTTTNANSTYRSMLAAASTCPVGDTAGYWAPALFRDGVKVNPAGPGVREQVYFRANDLAAGTRVEAFPPDLRVVAGNAHASSPAGNPALGHEIYWGCSDNSVGGKPLAPPRACPTGILSLHIGFPHCWDGVLTHRDDSAHLRYPTGGRCPAGFPHALPRLILRLEYPVGRAGGTITLASGGPWTAHGDFWNTWDQARLERLVSACLDAGRDCGTFVGTTPAAGTATTPATATTAPTTTAAATPTTTAPPTATGAATATSAAGAPSAAVGLPATGVPGGALLALTGGLLCLGGAALAGVRRRRARH